MRLIRTAMSGLAGAAIVITGCSNTGSDEPEAGSQSTTDSAESDDSNSSSDDPLKVGVIVPLSGEAGPNGGHVLAGVEAQAQIINEAGGLDGRQIEVLSRDDQSTPATGVSMATELIDEEVDVVMGGWNSPVTLAIQPELVRADIMNITSIPQNASILGGADDAAVRMNAGNAVGGYVAARYLSEELGAQRLALMLQNDAYGTDAGDFVRKNLPDDVEVVTEELFDFSDTDFRVAISNVETADPDAIFSANAAESSGQPALMQQLSQSNLDVPYFAGTGTVSHTVIEVAGEGANGAYSADLYFPTAEPWASSERNQEFIEVFGEITGGDMPDKFAALGAQSMDVWAQAVASAGTTDRTDVAAAIHGQTFEETLLGEVSFTDHGQMIFQMYAFQVEDEQITVLDEIPVPDEIWSQ